MPIKCKSVKQHKRSLEASQYLDVVLKKAPCLYFYGGNFKLSKFKQKNTENRSLNFKETRL